MAEAAETALAQLAAAWAAKTARGEAVEVETADDSTAADAPQPTDTLAATRPWAELKAAMNAES